MTNIQIIRDKIQNINIYISRFSSEAFKYMEEAPTDNFYVGYKKFTDGEHMIEKHINNLPFIECYRVKNKDNISVRLLTLKKCEEIEYDNCEQGSLLQKLINFENDLSKMFI